MMNTQWWTTTASVAALVMLSGPLQDTGISQERQRSPQKPPDNARTITAEQAAKIKAILSTYNASALTADDAKAIHAKFREAGIHAGPETRDAISAAGIDPEKLRTLAPPPTRERNAGLKPSTMEERLTTVEEKILAPLSLNAAQKEEVGRAFREFFAATDTLAAKRSTPGSVPEQATMEALEAVRNDRVKRAIPETLFPKYLELERAARDRKPFESRGRSK